ncbi:MAG: Cof-type HAD-IIB family hydrolase [Clostridium sp.]|nr:Cof-type HAD-IIB family hydrolase [Clostridium sp.]
MQRKILFTDLDGTLLDDKKQISERTKKALYALNEQGHILVFTTGRPLGSVLETRAALGLCFPDSYMIAYNGSLIWHCDSNTPVIEHTICMDDVRSILAETHALDVHCHTYENDTILFERDRTELSYYRTHIHLPARMVPDIASALGREPYKLIAIHLEDHALLEELKARVLAKLSARITAVFSNEHYLEFYPIDSGKGNAVRSLCDTLHIPLSDSAAIGDESNDISMIDAAGLGCAVANAKPAVREHADLITKNDNNHDGICELLAYFFGVDC